MSKIKGIQANSQNIFITNENSVKRQRKSGSNNQKQRSTVFAGNLNMGSDSIQAKKQKAQREAMKIISDVFYSDLKTDEEQKERLNHIEELKKENAESRSKLKDIQDRKDDLAKEYGVTQDSEEQRDLELIQKVRNAKDPFIKDKLTDEEKTRYAQIEKKGLTQYQEKVLALDEDADEIYSKMAENKKAVSMEEAAYKDTKMQLLKKSPMAGAQKQAEEHLEAAGKEIIGELYNEAKEHIDEKIEEAKEAQQEKQEKKKEEEEKEAVKEAKKLEQEIMLQNAKENAQDRVAELEAKTKSQHQAKLQGLVEGVALEDIHQSVDLSAEINREMQELLDKMKLLQEDIKGAAVDNVL